jgi:adenylate cyclase
MTTEEIEKKYDAAIAINVPETKADALNLLAWQLRLLSQYDKATAICEEALSVADACSSKDAAGKILNTLANITADRGDISNALKYFQQAIQNFEHSNDSYWLGAVLGNCGNIYKNLNEYNLALEYYHKALSLYEKQGIKNHIPVWLSNIGNVYHNLKEYDIALEFHIKAFALREEMGQSSEMGTVFSNIGNAYYEMGEYDKALEYYSQSLKVDLENEFSMDIAIDYGNLGRVFAKQEYSGYDPDKAEEYLVKAGAMFEKLGNKQYQFVFHKILSNLYRNQQRWEESDNEFRKFYALEKEVQSEEAKQEAEKMEYRRKVEEAERDRQVKLARFQEREKILDNILPSQITERLIKGEQPIADKAENVSIFFSDIVGFTTLSQHISAKELVSGLNELFIQYDILAKKYGLEKIKTIGDAYMAVCGVPVFTSDHASRTAQFALGVQELFVAGVEIAGHKVNIRIGLHCGEVVAGVIGEQKFAYDLWGDAVNTASRMESHGAAGKIHVSEEFVRELGMRNEKLGMKDKELTGDNSQFVIINSQFIFVPRGEIEIKGKGKMRTYFLEKVSEL